MRFWLALPLFFCFAPPSWAEVSASLLARLERYADLLDTLETDLAAAQKKYDSITATLTSTQEEITAERQVLMNDMSQLNVTTRDAVRLARFPWQAQMITDLNSTHVPRQTVMRQAQKALAKQLKQKQAKVHTLLTLEQELQNLLADQRTHLETLSTKRERITALHKKHLKTLRLEDKKLAASLAAALPRQQQVSLPLLDESTRAPLPHNLPLKGFIMQHYSPENNGSTLLGMPGATVQALNEGTVLFSGPFRNYGTLVILETGDGRHEIYGGLDYAHISTGAHLAKGDALGALPNTATPHLYYEVRQDDTPIPPVF